MVNRSAWEGKKKDERGNSVYLQRTKQAPCSATGKGSGVVTAPFCLTFCGEQLTTAANYTYDSDAMFL